MSTSSTASAYKEFQHYAGSDDGMEHDKKEHDLSNLQGAQKVADAIIPKRSEQASQLNVSGTLERRLPVELVYGNVFNFLSETDQAAYLCTHKTGLTRVDHGIIFGDTLERTKQANWWDLQKFQALTGSPFKSPAITHLDLSGAADLTDASLHTLLEHFPKLTSITLPSHAPLTDASLQYIAQRLPNLKELHISFCKQFTNAGLNQIANLRKLETLDVSNTNINDANLNQITLNAGATLRSINLHRCVNLTDAGLSHLARCAELRDLNISECPGLTEAGLQPLRGVCQKLTTLNISNTNVNPDHIPDFTELRSLTMQQCPQADDQNLSQIAQACTQLRELDIGFCINITDVRSVANCHHLEKLSMLHISELQNEDLNQITLNCPELKEIAISNCPHVTDNGLICLTRCKKLERLTATHVSGATDLGFAAVSSHCPELQYLNISQTAITDPGLAVITQHSRKMRLLNVQGCSQLTDDGFQQIGNMPNLRYLNITNTRLTNRTLEYVANGCPKMDDISLSECPRISDAGLRHLERCRHLVMVECIQTPGVTQSGIDRLTARLPDVKTIFEPVPRRSMCATIMEKAWAHKDKIAVAAVTGFFGGWAIGAASAGAYWLGRNVLSV